MGATNTHRASALWVPLLPSKGRRAYPWGMAAVCLWVNNPMKIHKKKMRARYQALAITSPCRSCLWWFGMCYRDCCVSPVISRATGTRGCQTHCFLCLKTLIQIPLLTDSWDSKYSNERHICFTCFTAKSCLLVSGWGHGRCWNIFQEICVICRYNSKLQIVTDAFRTPLKLYPSHFILSVCVLTAYWNFCPLLLTLQEGCGTLEN